MQRFGEARSAELRLLFALGGEAERVDGAVPGGGDGFGAAVAVEVCEAQLVHWAAGLEVPEALGDVPLPAFAVAKLAGRLLKLINVQRLMRRLMMENLPVL